MGIGALAQLPGTAAPLPPEAIVPGADVDTRWAAWIARGRVHERRVRRRFLIWVPIIAIGTAIAFALFRS